jgi:hypothetical protein
LAEFQSSTVDPDGLFGAVLSITSPPGPVTLPVM